MIQYCTRALRDGRRGAAGQIFPTCGGGRGGDRPSTANQTRANVWLWSTSGPCARRWTPYRQRPREGMRALSPPATPTTVLDLTCGFSTIHLATTMWPTPQRLAAHLGAASGLLAEESAVPRQGLHSGYARGCACNIIRAGSTTTLATTVELRRPAPPLPDGKPEGPNAAHDDLLAEQGTVAGR